MATVGTKADDLALALEEAIVSGEIAPGTVLRQEQLSEQYRVSRTPVREALRRLAALGLVSFVPNRGVRVRTISRDELHEAFMVRAELEALATEVAARKMTPEVLAELAEKEQHFAQISRDSVTAPFARRHQDGALVASWVSANHAFHDVVYAADAPSSSGSPRAHGAASSRTSSGPRPRHRPPVRAERCPAPRDPRGDRGPQRPGRPLARP
jgi:DNA-binding GntR family transcriptional regulator